MKFFSSYKKMVHFINTHDMTEIHLTDKVYDLSTLASLLKNLPHVTALSIKLPSQFGDANSYINCIAENAPFLQKLVICNKPFLSEVEIAMLALRFKDLHYLDLNGCRRIRDQTFKSLLFISAFRL